MQFGGEFALLLDGGEHGFAAVLEFAEVLEFLLNVADLDFVQVAGDFLAIAGNEGHRSAFVEQRDDGGHPLQGDVEQLGDMQQYGRGKSLEFSHESCGTSMIPLFW